MLESAYIVLLPLLTYKVLKLREIVFASILILPLLTYSVLKQTVRSGAGKGVLYPS